MSRQARRATAHVLVVDDEQDVLDQLSKALGRFGYTATTATSGESALRQTRERKFDLVIADLCLDGISGIQLTQALSRMHPQMPVVLMTARGDIEAGRLALEAGVSDFVTKPLETESLPFIVENNLQRKRLEARRLSEERADVLFKAIKAIAAAIDARSDYTSSHSVRMANLCITIARELDFSQDALNALELAAYIHDIGKVGTPDSVLTKPGELSEDEWIDILKHPATGADFLAGIEELTEVAAIVRHHHEQFDGTGYPDGLKGDAIPISARILAAADAFQAMTSERPYRGAMSGAEALGELRKNAGTQFDPAVVEAVERVAHRFTEAGDEKRAA